MYAIVTNDLNWHREKFAVGQGINRKNTGNLKMRFEWVPCNNHIDTTDKARGGGGGK